MADVKWTKNQLDAINARSGAVLVSAAAGSGKTAVLVERVINMITDPENPVDADRFLVVTYTKAAAGEMKERIGRRIAELLEADPYNANLHRQQLLLERAAISTIDSFCSSLVREYFYTLDIPADFRIGDEQELTILRNAAIQNVLERRYDDNDELFINTVEVFSSARDDKTLQQIVLMMYEFLRSHPFPENWIKQKAAMYNPKLTASQTEWGKVILGRAEMSAVYMKTLNEYSQKLMLEEPALNNSSFGDKIRDDGAFIDMLLKRIGEKDWDGIIHCLGTFSAGTLRAPKGYTDNPVKVTVSDYRKIVKDTIESINKLFFACDEKCRDDIADLAPVVGELFNIMILFDAEYSALKRERSVADFPDLEHWTLRLLAENTPDGIIPTDIAKSVSERFDYVMVDEYQDANSIQDTIFKAVSDNDRKLFVVGDVKQSIYRFRQAMPEIFIERKNRYNLYNPQKENYPAKIILDRNFRSREGITESVNFVFKNLMSSQLGDIDYTDEEKLVAGAQYDKKECSAVSFHLLQLNESDTGDKDTEEARYIAGLIRNIIETETVSDKGNIRKPRFSDFCILLRGAKSHGQTFADELAKHGINASSETGGSFFAEYEIQVMTSLLRIIDNPVQDIPLAAVMLSPIYGFTADELARYRADKKDISLYAALLKESECGDKKVSDFLEEISRLRKISAQVTADVILNRIYRETSFDDIVMADDDGEYRRKNLRMLLQYAKNYEKTGQSGLNGFVKYLDRLQENDCDLAAADRHSQSADDAVSIMTIHKSKGLEFPFCIVANLARKFNSDVTNEVLLHNNLGLGVRRRDEKNLCRYTTMPREAVGIEIKKDEMSEELRVLYVAMTRARERLILVASVPDIEKYLSSAAKKLSYKDGAVSPYTVSNASQMCDWIVYCLLVHPCGSRLREISSYCGEISHEKTPDWDIVLNRNLSENTDIHGMSLEDTAENEASSKEPCEEELNRIFNVLKDRLERTYKYEELTSIPVKVSASAIAHSKTKQSFAAVKKPDFMQAGKMSGAEKGTALHTFMQNCDFYSALLSVENEISRLERGGFITKAQAESVDTERVNAFLNSDLMKRMLSSDMLEREYRFTVEIPAGAADDSLKPPYSEAPIILQGAVDAIFEEDGRIVIVDYKTDRIADSSELASKYAPQLRLYKYAVEQTTGKEVSRCVLYSFYLNRYIDITTFVL